MKAAIVNGYCRPANEPGFLIQRASATRAVDWIEGQAMKVELSDDAGFVLWSFQGGDPPRGTASVEYLNNGIQRQIIDALRQALWQAEAQLGSVLQVSNIATDVCVSAAQI